MKKKLNLLFWQKGNDVFVSKFKLIEKSPELAPIFHSSMHYFGDCLLQNFKEVEEKLGNQLDKYLKLENVGIIHISEIDQDEIFKVTWWEKLTNEKKIETMLESAGFKIKIIPD
jgi:hypothetical protein